MVCHEVEVARVLTRYGAHVVLCSPDAVGLAGAVTELRAGPGRVAVLVGDPAEPGTSAAAGAMALELFGSEPRTIDSMADAYELGARSATVSAHPDTDSQP